MAVRFNGVETFKGAVLKIDEHMWLDGMLETTAIVWDYENGKIDRIQFGYYGNDGQNLAGGTAEVDATKETWRAVLRSLRPSANAAFCKSVTEYKQGIRKGIHAEVVKGRKVPKGTLVEVFWIGERPTFRSKNYSWMNETEMVAGCYDEAGNKLWIKAEYLKNVDPIKSPTAKERKKFIKAYIDKEAHKLGAPWA